jgi:peptide/nickel transport system ATP-binding protein
MKDLQRELGLTYLFISHDLAVVRHMANHIGVMYLGRIVEYAATDDLFARPQHPYTRLLLDAVPDLAMTGRPTPMMSGEVPNPINPPNGCHFHPRCCWVYDRCRSDAPSMKPSPALMATQVACHGVQEYRATRANSFKNGSVLNDNLSKKQ